MIAISRETDYAARVLLHLALQEPGARTTAQQIAQQRLIPRALVRRVVTRLAAANMIVTTRGSDGGIRLARPAGEISLLQVVEAMEGPMVLNQCVVEPGICPLVPSCNVHVAWMHARDVIRTHLQGITFDQLAGKKEESPWTH
jgi:Rrf2 family protein